MISGKNVDPEVIDACKRFELKKLYPFGSALSGSLEQSRDIDLLVEFDRDGYNGSFRGRTTGLRGLHMCFVVRI